MTDQRDELNANDALRHARASHDWTQDQTAEKVRTWLTGHGRPAAPGFDAQTVSRLERGVIRWPRADIRAALRAVFGADTDTALGFSPRRATRTPSVAAPDPQLPQMGGAFPAQALIPAPRLRAIEREDGDDPLRPRKLLLAGLAVTAAPSRLTAAGAAPPSEALLGELIVTRVRAALLGPVPAPTSPPAPAPSPRTSPTHAPTSTPAATPPSPFGCPASSTPPALSPPPPTTARSSPGHTCWSPARS